MSMPGTDESVWWSRTWNLMVTVLAIWAFFGFVIHMFVRPLDQIVIAGFPLGYYMAAQGSLIVFVVLVFWFARRQEAIDRDAGVAEPD